MGTTFTTMFTKQCNFCKGIGYEPSSQSTYCIKCAGYTYMSIFRLPECLRPEEKYTHSQRYITDWVEALAPIR
jgi:hypothetical protein